MTQCWKLERQRTGIRPWKLKACGGKKHRSNRIWTSKPQKAQELAVQGVFESQGIDGAENRIVCKAVKESVKPQISILILAIAPLLHSSTPKYEGKSFIFRKGEPKELWTGGHQHSWGEG